MEAYKGRLLKQGLLSCKCDGMTSPMNPPPPLPKGMTHFICTTSVPICLSFSTQKGATSFWSLWQFLS